MLETGHVSHRPSFPLDLYLPLLPALLSYKESTVSLQDRMSYMENDEGISRVDAMFVFSDLQILLLLPVGVTTDSPVKWTQIGSVFLPGFLLHDRFIPIFIACPLDGLGPRGGVVVIVETEEESGRLESLLQKMHLKLSLITHKTRRM
eukprot:gene32274-39033_t